MRRVALLFALAVVVTGCSETSTGSPTTGGDPTPTSESKAPTSSKAPVNRPKTIDLKKITDICAAFPAAKVQEFGLVSTGESKPVPDYPGAKGCDFRTPDRKFLYQYLAIISSGVGLYAEGQGGAVRKDVAGFPAYELKTDSQVLRACSLYIDVADGQMLNVGVIPNEAGGDQQAACDKALPFAEAVMAGVTAGS